MNIIFSITNNTTQQQWRPSGTDTCNYTLLNIVSLTILLLLFFLIKIKRISGIVGPFILTSP